MLSSRLHKMGFKKFILQRWTLTLVIFITVIIGIFKLNTRWQSGKTIRNRQTRLPEVGLTSKRASGKVHYGIVRLKNKTFSDDFTPIRIKGTVPKIVHFAWYGTAQKSTFRFHHYIGLLAALKHIKPDKIMFWHERPPTGGLWQEVLIKMRNIEMVFRKAPTEIRGRPVHIPEHQSDVVRLEAVMKYGGIYLDLDVIALKSFDPLLKYDVTMGSQGRGGLCNGVIIGKRGAEFFKIWHEAYRTFDDKDWAHHSVYLPYKLYQEHRGLVHVENRTLHRPSWYERQWIYEEGKLYDWSSNYAMHLWYRFYNKDLTPDSIRKLNTTLGQIFRYIYYGSPDFL